MKQLIYIGDPLCSWCWGFSPVLRQLREQAKNRAESVLVLGGLRVGEGEALNDTLKQYLRHHWQEVNRMTGQPFDFSFFERDDFTYNTESACRAVVAARELQPESVFDFYDRVQEAFYAENKDVTQADMLCELADAFGLDVKKFEAAFNSPEIVEKTKGDFQTARNLGITGFPSVVLRNGTHYSLLTRGYQPYDALRTTLETWLNTAPTL